MGMGGIIKDIYIYIPCSFGHLKPSPSAQQFAARYWHGCVGLGWVTTLNFCVTPYLELIIYYISFIYMVLHIVTELDCLKWNFFIRNLTNTKIKFRFFRKCSTFLILFFKNVSTYLDYFLYKLESSIIKTLQGENGVLKFVWRD